MERKRESGRESLTWLQWDSERRSDSLVKFKHIILLRSKEDSLRRLVRCSVRNGEKVKLPLCSVLFFRSEHYNIYRFPGARSSFTLQCFPCLFVFYFMAYNHWASISIGSEETTLDKYVTWMTIATLKECLAECDVCNIVKCPH